MDILLIKKKMRLKKDIFTDILYGSFIGIVLLVREQVVIEKDLEKLILSNLIIISLFYLWLKTLSSKFRTSIFVSSKEKKYSKLGITVLGVRIISDMIQMKVAIFIIMSIVLALFRENLSIDSLNFSSIFQLLTSAVYVVSIYSLMQFVGKKSYFNWSFIVALFLPFLIFMFLYSFFNIENSEYFVLIPMNFYMIMDINDTLIIALSSVLFVSTFFLFTFCLKLIIESKKIYNLPPESKKIYNLPSKRLN